MASKLYELNLDIFEIVTSGLDLGTHFNLCLTSHKTLQYLSQGFLRRCGLKYLDDDEGTLDTLTFDLEPRTRLILVVLGLSRCVSRVRCLRCTFFDPDRRVSLQHSAYKLLLQSIAGAQTIVLDFKLVSVAKLPIRYQRILEALAEKHPSEVSVSRWRSSIIRADSNEASYQPDPSHPFCFSSITAMSLSYCQWDSSDWNNFGLRLFLPSIKELHIDTAMRSPYMLFKFLRRHRTITLLHIFDFTDWEPFQPFHASDFLPQLQSLHAPITFIVTLFDEGFIGAKALPTDLEISCYPNAFGPTARWRDILKWIGKLPGSLEKLPVTMKIMFSFSWWDLPALPTPSVSIAGLTLEFRSCSWVEIDREHYLNLVRWLSHFGDFPWLELVYPFRPTKIIPGSDFSGKVFAQLPSVNTVKVDGHSYLRSRYPQIYGVEGPTFPSYCKPQIKISAPL